jgi:hypothetical protein
MGVAENTALLEAAMAGHEVAAEAAIKAGADLNCIVRSCVMPRAARVRSAFR